MLKQSIPNYVRVIIEGGGYDANTGQQVGQMISSTGYEHRSRC
jgi:hypothetical protein